MGDVDYVIILWLRYLNAVVSCTLAYTTGHCRAPNRDIHPVYFWLAVLCVASNVKLETEKAAKHFEKVLENAEVTVEIFSVIRGVYLMTRRQDRVLLDIVTAKLYTEIQH